MVLAKFAMSCAICALLLENGLGQGIEDAEFSGVTVRGDNLVIVSDSDPKHLYLYPIRDIDPGITVLSSASFQRQEVFPVWLPLDYESVDYLSDGRALVLSERLRSLIVEDLSVIECPKQFAEIGNRGIEGICVKPNGEDRSLLAMIWEGGYPEVDDLSSSVLSRLGNRSFRPLISVHQIDHQSLPRKLYLNRVIELQMPVLDGEEPWAQRFRAPDLVWFESVSGEQTIPGFIVLMSSGNSVPNPEYRYCWLMRFDMEGRPIGQPLDLNELVPDNLKHSNWEGLGWVKRNERLILVHDMPNKHPDGENVALVVDIPEGWK